MAIVFWVFAQVRLRAAGAVERVRDPRCRRLDALARPLGRAHPAPAHAKPGPHPPNHPPTPPTPPRAQLPQFISNWRNKSAEALSPWFLAQWLLGDTFNLTGALLQGQQLPTTTYTAM